MSVYVMLVHRCKEKFDFKNKNGKHYKNNFILNLVHFIVPVSYLKGNNA